MRRRHQAQHGRTFTVAYWASVGAVLALPVVVTAVEASGTGANPLPVLAVPAMLAIVAGTLIFWRWSTHHIEIADDAVVERRHPILLYHRRRGLDEITEVVPCPPERRTAEHGEAALLIRCRRRERDLVVWPVNAPQFLDDLQAVEPRFERYRGRVVRHAAAG